jgi:hypothetical protein
MLQHLKNGLNKNYKMEDRIQVNGIWYVKETTKAVSNSVEIKNIDEFDVTRSLSRIWENDDWVFEAKILLTPDGTELEDTWGDCWITITDKDTNEEHSIDNPTWMLGVYEGDPLSMREANKMMTPEGIGLYRGFLSLLIKNGWLKKEKE